MAIQFQCAHCQKVVAVGDEHAGKKGRCPFCKGVVAIPAAKAPTANPPSPAKRTNTAASSQPAVAANPKPTPKPAAKPTTVSQPPPAQTSPAPMAATKPKVPQATPLPSKPATHPVAKPAAVPPPSQGAPLQPVHLQPLVPQQTVASPASPLVPLNTGNTQPTAQRMPVAAASPLKPLDPNQVAHLILNSFRSVIPPREISSSYKFGVFATAVFAAVLPLIYISAVLFLVLGSLLTLVTGLFFITPFMVVVAIFLIKPLFFSRAAQQPSREVTPETEPLLWAFVERICQATNAPRPRHIRIDCDMNAGATFTHGWRSMFTNDLTLIIGMPWVSCLTVQQMGGILAHEFGHFSQGAAMRLSYFTRTIDHWFARVVYERDKFDAGLEYYSQVLDLRIGLLLYILRFLIWISRGFFWLLLYSGRVVLGYMSQQMEFDADSYEIRLCGSDSFAKTCERLELLQYAFLHAIADLRTAYREGRLVDNLPRLIETNVGELPPEFQQKLRQEMMNEKTKLFASHPATSERIAHALAMSQPGVFACEMPAKVLFRNFDLTAKQVTWDFYYSEFEIALEMHQMTTVEAIQARKAADEKGHESRNRFFSGVHPVLRQLRLPSSYLQESQMSAAIRVRLEEKRKQMSALGHDYHQNYKRYDDLDSQMLCTEHLLRLYRNRLTPRRVEGMPVWYENYQQANSGKEWIAAELGRLATQMTAYEEAAGQRLFDALTLLMHPAVAAKLTDGNKLQEEARRLLTMVSRISGHLNSLLYMRNLNHALGGMVDYLEDGGEAIFLEIRELARWQHEQILQLRPAYDDLPYPFDHADGPRSIAQHIVKTVPFVDQIGEVHDASEGMIDRLIELYSRGLGRICEIAEMVELLFDLKPLEQVRSLKEENQAAT